MRIEPKRHCMFAKFALILVCYSSLAAVNWTKPTYFEPQFFGETFAINRDESKIYYATGSKIYWRERLQENQWSNAHVLFAPWNNSQVIRNFWIDPDEAVSVWSEYTNNWQLFFSRKDSNGVWGPRMYFPQNIDTPDREWWGSFSPSGRWFYFSRDFPGFYGTLLRAEYINDSTFTNPETLAIGEYRINWGSDEWVGTLSPREDELIFMGYRYWYNEGWGANDLFSSTLNCEGTWRSITRLDCSYDKQFEDIHYASGDELFPQLSADNRTLYFERFHWEDSDSGLVPGGGYCFSKRIWSQIHPVCSDSEETPIQGMVEPTPFEFGVTGPDSLHFLINDVYGNEIVRHSDTVKTAGLYRIRWYGINDTDSTIVDGDYRLLIQSDALTDTINFSISAGDILLGIHEERIPNTLRSFDLVTFPNPFNPTTTIRYTPPENGRVTVTIYDQLGRQVNQLVSAKQNAGEYTVQWNGRDDTGRQLASGLYFCQVSGGGFSRTVKLVLIK